jgi:hypothetical protein
LMLNGNDNFFFDKADTPAIEIHECCEIERRDSIEDPSDIFTMTGESRTPECLFGGNLEVSQVAEDLETKTDALGISGFGPLMTSGQQDPDDIVSPASSDVRPRFDSKAVQRSSSILLLETLSDLEESPDKVAPLAKNTEPLFTHQDMVISYDHDQKLCKT